MKKVKGSPRGLGSGPGGSARDGGTPGDAGEPDGPWNQDRMRTLVDSIKDMNRQRRIRTAQGPGRGNRAAIARVVKGIVGK